MSLIVSVHVSTGIVLSGDSRTTGTLSQQVPNPQNPTTQITVQTNIVLSDSAEKIFLLYDRFAVGTFGDALVNDMPIAHYVEQFRLQSVSTPPATTQSLANDLLAYFRSLNPVPNVSFAVAGYDNNDPWMMWVNVQANTVTRQNVDPQTNQVQYGVFYGGDTHIVGRLLSQPQFNPPFQVMNLQDAVDFSRHLIRSTIDQMRFEPRFPTVGGAIDTAIVTSSKANFIAHKTLTSS